MGYGAEGVVKSMTVQQAALDFRDGQQRRPLPLASASDQGGWSEIRSVVMDLICHHVVSRICPQEDHIFPS